MLVRTKVLSEALRDLEARNQLMSSLNFYSGNDNLYLYKFILSFMLGCNFNSNELEIILGKKYRKHYRKIYAACLAIYYCLLILDKEISLLSSNTPIRTALENCQRQLMSYFNERYYIITQNPRGFLAKCKIIIERIELNPLVSSPILKRAKTLCSDEMNYALSDNFFSNNIPRTKTMSAANDSYKLSIKMQNKISRSEIIHPFYFLFDMRRDWGNLTYNKIYVRSHDGIILDGLCARDVTQYTKTTVLALVGHFQSEHVFFSYRFKAYQELFATNVVFINHRNFSTRSNLEARSALELASDIVQFVKHFRNRNQNIVLYGMCGGTAHMILAAEMLHKEKIPFKLIVDRFAKKYSDCLDVKSHLRALPRLNPIPPVLNTAGTILFFLIVLLCGSFLYLLLRITGNHYNFGETLRQLPENDVLILQGKSKKRPSMKEPLFTDFFIHPKNDLRQSIKDHRHSHKLVLKELTNDCSNLASCYPKENKIYMIFTELAACFKQCLELIDNEKMEPIDDKRFSNKQDTYDIHSLKLYELTTRHKLPMGKFLNGFFQSAEKSCKRVLSDFKATPIDDFRRVLTISQTDAKRITNPEDIFIRFFELLTKHTQYICYMGDRLLASGLKDISLPLMELLQMREKIIKGDLKPSLSISHLHAGSLSTAL